MLLPKDGIVSKYENKDELISLTSIESSSKIDQISSNNAQTNQRSSIKKESKINKDRSNNIICVI